MKRTIGTTSYCLILVSAFYLYEQTTLTSAAQATPIEQETALEDDYKEQADDDLETKLLKEKIRAAIRECGYKKRRISDGSAQVFVLFDAQQRLIAAQLEFHKKPKKIISLLEKHVEFSKKIEEDRKIRMQNGIGRPDEHAQAIYMRAGVELQLLRAKRKFGLGDVQNGK